MSATLAARAIPSLHELRSYRRALFERGTAPGRSGKSINLWPVGVTEPAGEFLRDLVIREGASRTLEVGMGLGLSTIFIAEALLSGRAAPRELSHVVFDPMPELLDWAGYDQLRESGVLGLVDVQLQDSRTALPSLIAAGRVFDFIYVDGAHWFDFVMLDILNALRLVRPGGLVVVDDHWMPAVQMALAFVHSNGMGELDLYDPQGPGKRFVGVRRPQAPDTRAWDHYVDFSRESLPEYPWRGQDRPLSSGR